MVTTIRSVTWSGNKRALNARVRFDRWVHMLKGGVFQKSSLHSSGQELP
jgi:hypothetical protein